MLRNSVAYQKQFDERINNLPDSIAKHVNPGAIAPKINESLNQQFIGSTIPQTEQAG
jgi:hypothetical protein